MLKTIFYLNFENISRLSIRLTPYQQVVALFIFLCMNFRLMSLPYELYALVRGCIN